VGDPRLQRFLFIRVEAQVDNWADAGAGAAALVLWFFGDCARPGLMISTTLTSNQSKDAALAPVLATARFVQRRKRRVSAGQLNRERRALRGAAKPAGALIEISRCGLMLVRRIRQLSFHPF
jgi:hypothetical protein